MKKVSRRILILCVSLLAGVTAAYLPDAGLFLQGKAAGEQVEYVSSEAMTVIPGEEGFQGLRLDLGEKGKYVGRITAKLMSGDRPTRVTMKVYCSQGDGTESCIVYEDLNPAWLREETFRVARDKVRAIEFHALRGSGQKGATREGQETDTTLLTGEVIIDNRPSREPYLFLFVFLGAAGLLLLARRKADVLSPSRAFLITVCTLGVCMVLSLPRNKIGCDEETHLQAVVQLASFPAGKLHISDTIMNQLMVTEFNHPDAQPGNSEEMEAFDQYLADTGDYKTGAREPDFAVPANRIPAYLPMAAAVKAGKALGLSWPACMGAARLANLMVYSLLMYLALRILPTGRWLMFVIALLPQNLFLASTVSYDPFVTGTLSVGMAFLLRQMLCGASLRDTVGMLVFFILGCLVKAVYAPLLLVCLILPETCFSSKKNHRRFCGAAIAAVLLLIAVFILPTAAAPAQTGDLRGGDTSEVSQVGYILAHPFAYAGLLISQMVRWIPQCFIGPDCTTFMGHIINGGDGEKGFYVVHFLLMLISAAAGRLGLVPEASREEQGQGEKREYKEYKECREGRENREYREYRNMTAAGRVWIFLMTAACCVLIWTSMYVAFTVPGAAEISGVQGRYFIPLLFPLYLLLSQGRKEQDPTAGVERKHTIWYYAVVYTQYVFLAAALLKYVIIKYCM